MASKTATARVTVESQAQAARQGALKLQSATTAQKNQALEFLAQELESHVETVIAENQLDVEAARKADLKASYLDRLTVNPGRLVALAQAVRDVIALPDPVGEVTGRWLRPNGLRILRQRVPIGVIAIIYESRPNVTVDASVLCLKAGNAVILKGGSEALNTNRVLTSLIAK